MPSTDHDGFTLYEIPPREFRKKRRCVVGTIIHWQDSESGGWGIAIAGSGRYFFHRLSVLAGEPRVGMRVTFTPIPRRVTGMARAIEVTCYTRGNNDGRNTQ